MSYRIWWELDGVKMARSTPENWLSNFKTLPSGEVVQIRPIRSDDARNLKAFLGGLSRWERDRLNWQFVSDHVWGAPDSSFSDCITYRVAVIRDKIIGIGVLNYARAGPCRFVGEANVIVDLKYRNLGVGNLVMEEYFRVAKDTCLRKLVVRTMVDKCPEVMKTHERSNRVRVSILRNLSHDATGPSGDLILLEMPLGLLDRKGNQVNMTPKPSNQGGRRFHDYLA